MNLQKRIKKELQKEDAMRRKVGAIRAGRSKACRYVVHYEVGSLGSLQPPPMAQSCLGPFYIGYLDSWRPHNGFEGWKAGIGERLPVDAFIYSGFFFSFLHVNLIPPHQIEVKN
ncbi:hypothetical protein Tco_0132385 [Tanacetum coccineum]